MQKPPKKPLNKYLVLTGISFQMGITIYLFIYFGKKLDLNYSNGGKLFTIIFTLLGLAISLYNLLRQLNKINQEDS